jgi:hypothetical protein
MMRAFGISSAYNSTVKPAGTFGKALSGLGTTLPKFGFASVGPGRGGTLFCANIAADTIAIPRLSKIKVRVLFITYST